MKQQIIIEIAGGIVTQVTIHPLPESGNLEVILVDWDNIKRGDSAEILNVSPLHELSDVANDEIGRMRNQDAAELIKELQSIYDARKRT